MFHAARVETGYPASSKRQAGDFSTSLFLRQKLDVFNGKGVVEWLASTGTAPRVQTVHAGDEVDPQERSLVCRRCGYARVRNARFCTRCGAPRLNRHRMARQRRMISAVLARQF
jgi:uncharacterized paraquat-inducible protein A